MCLVSLPVSLPALLDIPTMLFFCFQKLMSFLNAKKSNRSCEKKEQLSVSSGFLENLLTEQMFCGVMLLWRTDVEGSHKKGKCQEIKVGVHKDPFDLVGVLLCETCNAEMRQ